MTSPLESFKKLPAWGKAGVAVGGAAAVFLIWRAHSSAAAAVPAGGTDAASGNGLGDGSVTSGGTTGTVTGTGVVFPDDASWSQAVVAGLSEIGFDPQAVSTALGDYLAGKPLTAAEAAIVYAADASYGLPPVNPPPIILAGKGTAASGNDTIPSVSGGHIVSLSANEAVVGWTGKNAKSYRVTIHGPGPENGRMSTVTGAQATYGGLQSGHAYTVTVVPVGADGHTGKPGAVTFKTTATRTLKKGK